MRAGGSYRCDNQHARTRVWVKWQKRVDGSWENKSLWFTRELESTNYVRILLEKGCSSGYWRVNVKGEARNVHNQVVHVDGPISSPASFINC